MPGMTTVGPASRRASSRAVDEMAPGPGAADICMTLARTQGRTACVVCGPDMDNMLSSYARNNPRYVPRVVSTSGSGPRRRHGRKQPQVCNDLLSTGFCLRARILPAVSRCQVQSWERCPPTAGAAVCCLPTQATRKPFCHGLTTATHSRQSIKSETACMRSSPSTTTTSIASRRTLYPTLS
jgi:hypothetical protein